MATNRMWSMQTLERLQHTGPFTAPKFQGDESSEVTTLRKWVNDSPVEHDSKKAPFTPEYQVWARKCPFKREVSAAYWVAKSWFWTAKGDETNE